METITAPHHDLSYDEGTRRDVNSFTVDEIRGFDKQTAVQYARASGLQETGMSVNEVALLYDLLEQKGPCNIVELGRNYGCSTRIFIQHVIRHGGYFESWDLKHWGNLKESFSNQGFKVRDDGEDYWLTDSMRIRVANSMKTAILEDFTVGFLLVDTEHSTANCLYEYGRWRNYLTSGSMVAFHDSTLSGVSKAIDIIKEVEFAEVGDRICKEYVNEREDGFGIKIIQWKG
jgi:cephalosporin hydroxylase